MFSPAEINAAKRWKQGQRIANWFNDKDDLDFLDHDKKVPADMKILCRESG